MAQEPSHGEPSNDPAEWGLLFQHAGDAIFLHDLHGNLIDANPRALELTGYTRPEALELNAADLLPPEFRRGFRAMFREIRRKGSLCFETFLRKKNGESFAAEISSSLVNARGRTVVQGILRDTTARNRREDRLRESLEQLQTAFDALSDAVSVVDLDGTLLRVNRAMTRLVGGGREEVVGRRCWERVHRMSAPVEGCPVARMRRSGRSESAVLSLEGRTYRVTVDPVRDPTGDIAAAVHVMSDITEQERREDNLRRALKLESLATLAGGLAHEFNNVMTILWGNVDLARMYATPGDRIHRCMGHAAQACERAKNLSRPLLTFARTGAPTVRRTPLSRLLRDSVSPVLEGTRTACVFELPEDLWDVEIDRTQIDEAVRHLARNAVEAMDGRGTLRVCGKNVPADRVENRLARPGPAVEVSVVDQGIGVPEPNLARIFDPYFTTKEGSGGLGLSLADSILYRHGSKLRVESISGEGSTFSFCLPAVARADRPEVSPGPPAPAGRLRVLFMDDEALVRDTAGRMLEALGHEVRTCADGGEAVALFRRALDTGTPFDLVMLDLTVPGGMGGKEALERLRAVTPGVRAVVSSGYADDPVFADPAGHGFAGTIPKPYTLEGLRDVLDRIRRQ